MFGGVAFMHLGPIGNDLMVRVGPNAYDDCLAKAHVTEMKFTGRPMRGMITVLASGKTRINGCGDGLSKV